MSTEFEYLKLNINEIKAKIAEASVKSGRKPDEVILIAVSKTVDTERINEAIDAGISELGENKVQELCEKYDIINRGCNWHLIGHLQTNKVKYIIDKVKMIHSIDSLDLAREINKRAEKIGRIMDVLVQVNVAGEDTKFGIPPYEVPGFIREISRYGNIKVKGLMAIAPFVKNPETIRYVFTDLRKIFIDIKKENIDNIDMEYLSMGMSNDFEIAVEEGSNMVRIGTAIFGKRQYNISI